MFLLLFFLLFFLLAASMIFRIAATLLGPFVLPSTMLRSYVYSGRIEGLSSFTRFFSSGGNWQLWYRFTFALASRPSGSSESFLVHLLSGQPFFSKVHPFFGFGWGC